MSLAAGTAHDLVDQVRLATLQVAQESRRVVVAATESGKISAWCGASGESIGFLDRVDGRIEELRLASTANKPCPHCGELSADGFTLAFSVDQFVQIYRASTQLQANRCSCPSTLFSSPTGGKRSGGSISSTSSSSPVRSRSNLPSLNHSPSTLSVTEYPMSAHGVHSRRLNGAETNRRQSSESDLSSDGWVTENDLSFDPRPQFIAPDRPGTSAWHHVRLDRVGTVACDRGAWDVVGDVFIGIRRKSRPRDPQIQPEPLSRVPKTNKITNTMHPALERWELWTFDPSSKNNPLFCSSSLSSILVYPNDKRGASSDGGRSPSAPAGSLLLKRQVNFQRFMGEKVISRNCSRGRTDGDRSSSPSRAQCSNDIYPRLPFTRVMPLVVAPDGTCISGLGNTVGLVRSSQPAAGTSGCDPSSSDSTLSHLVKKRL